jgi:hypothetical protein
LRVETSTTLIRSVWVGGDTRSYSKIYAMVAVILQSEGQAAFPRALDPDLHPC